MMKDVDAVVVAETSAKERIEHAFWKENFCSFEFNISEEEDGALSKLQIMLLLSKGESIDDPFECMDELVGLFKDRVLESKTNNRMVMTLYFISGRGYGGFRCRKLLDRLFGKEGVPGIVYKAFSRVTGIGIFADEIDISWYINPDKKTRRPGERWRLNPAPPTIEINAVLVYILRIAGPLAVEDRLVRWGTVIYIESRIRIFQCEYAGRPGEWRRVLGILDICEEDIQTTGEFTDSMHLLDPISDLIPIKVLEVITVFRVLFKLSLRGFELAYKRF